MHPGQGASDEEKTKKRFHMRWEDLYIDLGDDDDNTEGQAKHPKERNHPFRWLAVEATARTHPDTLLRKLGVILQEGSLKVGFRKYEDMYYDTWLWKGFQHTPAWCRVRAPGVPAVTPDGEPVRTEHLVPSSRRDTVPAGAIYIIGHIDLNRMQLLELRSEKRSKARIAEHADEGQLEAFFEHQQKSQKEAVQKAKEKKKEMTGATKGEEESDSDGSDEGKTQHAPLNRNAQKELEFDAPKVPSRKAKRAELHNEGLLDLADPAVAEDDIHNIIDANDDDSTLLTKADVSKFVKQYLCRSIPLAAKRTGSIIVTSGEGDINYNLAKGAQALMAESSKEKVDEPGGATDMLNGRVPLVGFHPYQRVLEPLPPNGEAEEWELASTYRDQVMSPFYTHHVLVKTNSPGFADEGEPMKATTKEVTDTVNNFLVELSKGYQGDEDRKVKDDGTTLPPFRHPTRVVTILIGGHKQIAKFELLESVQKKWPILVVEGTGGYADVLAELINKVEKLAGGVATPDDFKQYLSGVDVQTAQIINEGQVTIIRKGMVPESMARAVQLAVSGEEVLRQAWEKYAIWSEYAEQYEERFQLMMLLILILGICATGLSIFQTFLQLTFEDETDGKNDNNTQEWAGGSTSPVAHIYAWLNLVVIALPIAISLVQSISNKFNAGAKWVSLRSAAEGVLSEIYQFRTRTGLYSDKEVKKAKDKKIKLKREHERKKALGEDTADAQGGQKKPAAEKEGEEEDELLKEGYSSRSELLHLKLAGFTKELVHSEVVQDSIPTYTGAVPPQCIRDYGDDGFSDLEPQSYVELRILPKIEQYLKDSAHLDKQKTRINLTIYGFGALGTALAAMATYDQLRDYNLGAWVALTTSIGNALTRYLDYMKTEWLHKKYTSTMHELQNYETWWLSRGGTGDTSDNRNKLIQGCEDKILDEVAEFKQQLKIAVAEAAKEAERQEEERANIIASLQAGETKAADNKIKDLGLTELNAETLEKALKNPLGPQAKKLRGMMQQLDTEFGILEKVKQQAEKTEVGRGLIATIESVKDIAPGVLDAAGNIIDGAKMGVNMFDVGVLIPKEVKEFMKDTRKRRAFLSQLDPVNGKGIDPWQLGLTDIQEMAKKCGRQFRKQMKELPYRMVIETVQQAAFEELFQEFDDALDKLGLRTLDFIESREHLDDFLAEMRKLTSLPWKDMDIDQIVFACGAQDVKESLKKLSESKLRAVLKRAEKYFMSTSPALELFNAMQSMASELDIDMLFKNNEVMRCEVLARVEALTGKFPAGLLSKDELLSVFPRDVQAQLKKLPHVTLTGYIAKLQQGSPGVKMLSTCLTSIAERTRSLDPRQVTTIVDFTPIEVLLHSYVNKEKFVMAVRKVTQIDINTLTKSTIIRKVRNIPGMDDKMIEDLKACSEEAVREVMSGVRALYGNSYVGRLFDVLTDEMTSFDANIILDFEDQERLVSQMQVFRGVTIAKKSKQWILSMLAYSSLVEKCSKLSLGQLQELLQRLTVLMGSTFNKRVFDKVLNQLHFQHQDSFREAGVANWSEQVIDRFVTQAVAAPEWALQANRDTTQPEYRVALLGNDAQLLRSTAALAITELKDLVIAVREFADNPVIANVFEATSRDITNKVIFNIYDSAFTLPPVRNMLVLCMTNLLCNTATGKPVHLHEITSENADRTIDRLRLPVQLPLSTKMVDGVVVDPGIMLNQQMQEMLLMCGPGGRSAELIDSLVEVFRGPKLLSRVVEFLLGELKISTGYRIFLNIALDISTFNLREVFLTARSRQGLCSLLLIIMWNKRLGFRPRGKPPDELVAISLDNSSVLSKEAFLRVCDEYDDGGFESITKDLAQLSFHQIKTLVEHFHHYIQSQCIGVFFQCLERSILLRAHELGNRMKNIDKSTRMRKVRAEERAKRARNEAIAAIKNTVRLHPEEVRRAFDNFDARIFASRLASEKRQILSRFLPTDSVISIICGYNESQIRGFFSYLSNAPQYTELDTIDMGGRPQHSGDPPPIVPTRMDPEFSESCVDPFSPTLIIPRETLQAGQSSSSSSGAAPPKEEVKEKKVEKEKEKEKEEEADEDNEGKQ